MANSLLSPTIITKEALRYLHANLPFLGTVNRQYDKKFANEGASPSGKIGPSLTIRMPNQYTVRNGATLQVQDVTEDSQTLTVSTQKGIDMNFTSVDRTLTIDEFGPRYLEPAMARLATEIESDVLTNVVKDVYNFVDNDASAISFLNFLTAQQYLDEALTPEDGNRVGLLSLTHNTKFVNAVTGTYNPQSNIGEQWRKGIVAKNTAGMDEVYRSSLLTSQATGTAAKTTGYSVDSTGTVTGSTITIKTGSTTFKKGDVITIATLNAVHPETKADLGRLKQFVVTADTSTSATSLSISPSIVTTGAKQNVSAAITADQVIVKVGAGASETYQQSLVYHKDAFTFVTADLVDMSKFGCWGARETMDNISMRVYAQADITNDKIPLRIDVLYGYKTIRPQLACRIHADG